MSDNRQVVKQLDHIIARVDDAEPLFKFLSEALQLPVAWPLRSYPSFTSGGIALGNLYLEVLSCAPKRGASSNSERATLAARRARKRKMKLIEVLDVAIQVASPIS